MSTRSRIGMVMPDGKIRSVYCHNDGYLSDVGITLHEHYLDSTEIGALIDLGDLSSLDVDLTSSVAYMRDRGEKDCSAIVSDTETDFLTIDSSQEFMYLWKDGKWIVWSVYDMNIPLDLTAALTADAMGE